jgi:hypothetical protein
MNALRMLALATLLALTQQQPQNGSVEIRALDSLTKKGVPAARITLVYFAPEPPNDVKILFTDAEGRVLARNLPLGNYVARIEREGYQPTVRLGTDSSSFAFSILADRPNYATELEFIPLGTVSGRVQYANGDPFPRAKIALLWKTYLNGSAVLSAKSQGETDDRGVFRLTETPPGDYFVRVANSESDALPRLSYHPGVTDTALAAPITVRGNDISIEMKLPREPVFMISGTVISPTPLILGSITLISANPNTLEEASSPLYFQPSKPNEFAFEIAGVSPGNYFLFPTARFSGPQFTLDNRDLTNKVAVTIVDKNLENLRITMQPGIDLKGRIIVDGDASDVRMESLKVVTHARERNPVLVVMRDVVGESVSGSGDFVLGNLTPDVRYALRVSRLPSGAYVSDIRQAGRSIYAEGFIKAGASDGNIEIRVDTRGGTISGTVRDASNQPAKQTAVIVVPDPPRRTNPLLYTRANTDDAGAFTIRGVAPGEYQLFSWVTAPPQGAEEDAQFLAPYEGKGTIVRVAPSTQTNTQLRLLPQ